MALIERAYAQINYGSYDFMNEGGQPLDALYNLTGAPTKKLDLLILSNEKFWESLKKT